MYHTLIADESGFAEVVGLQIVEFESLYCDFMEMRHCMKMEKRNDASRQAKPGAGRKYTVSWREQLLSVLLWSNLSLHPRSISQLLNVHVSTFARMRRRVLIVLDRLDVEIELPDRQSYKEIDQLVETYPHLLRLKKESRPLAANK